MSTTISTRPPQRASSLQVPIRTYDTLAEAERAVSLLRKCRFPLEYVALAARGVERCRHRAASPGLLATAVFVGALAGASLAMLARLTGVLAPRTAVVALVFGAVIGAIVAGAASVMLAAKHSSCYCGDAISAHSYDVLVDAQWAGDAAHVLAVADCGQRRKEPEQGLAR